MSSRSSISFACSCALRLDDGRAPTGGRESACRSRESTATRGSRSSACAARGSASRGTRPSGGSGARLRRAPRARSSAAARARCAASRSAVTSRLMPTIRSPSASENDAAAFGDPDDAAVRPDGAVLGFVDAGRERRGDRVLDARPVVRDARRATIRSSGPNDPSGNPNSASGIGRPAHLPGRADATPTRAMLRDLQRHAQALFVLAHALMRARQRRRALLDAPLELLIGQLAAPPAPSRARRPRAAARRSARRARASSGTASTNTPIFERRISALIGLLR